MTQLTEEQIKQLLPFDLEIAKKHPEWVYWDDGKKKQLMDINGYITYANSLRLFPHTVHELHLLRETVNGSSFIVGLELEEKNEMLEFEQVADLRQTIKVLVFDETLLNE